MQAILRTGVVMGVVGALGLSVWGQAPDAPGGAATRRARVVRAGVRPVPAEIEQVDVRRGLKSKYEREYADVSAAGKRKLATTLYRDAGGAAGDAMLYVTLMEARELAQQAGEVEFAVQIASEIGQKFDVDADALRSTTLAACEKARLTPRQAYLLAEQAQALAEERLAADDFDGAARAAQMAEEASRRSGDGTFQKELGLLAEFCKEVLRWVPKYEAASAKLAEEPENAEANQSAGEFLLVVKQEWGRSLVMLSRGTNAFLKSAAAAELSNARGTELLKAADNWAEWGSKKQGPSRVVAEGHARRLYEKSSEGLSGADLDHCLEAMGALVNRMPVNSELADVKLAETQLGETRWAWWEGLGLRTLEMRDDAADLQGSQAIVNWKPKLTRSDALPEMPEEGSTKKDGRLMYRLRVLCVDEAGQSSVLEREGKVPLRSVEKPIRLTGPKNSDIKKVNGGKVMPAGAHLVVTFDGVVVSERVWKLPVKQAWWLK